MTIDELRAAALAAAVDENETTGCYLRWDAHLCAFRWEAAFTTGEEHPDWADESWPTVRGAMIAEGFETGWLMGCTLQTKEHQYFLEDWDGLSNHVLVSGLSDPEVISLPINELVRAWTRDLSDYFETEDDGEGEE
jgi:hypothetical protein